MKTIRKDERKVIVEQIKERGVWNSDVDRIHLNIHFFEQVEDCLEGKERKFKIDSAPQTLFSHLDSKEMNTPMMAGLKIFISGFRARRGKSILTHTRNRLLSYHYIEGDQRKEFEDIVKQRRKK